MFNANGVQVIDNALSQFEKIKTSLEKGIQRCNEVVAENKVKIAEIEAESKTQETAKLRAEKVVKNLSTLLL